MRDNSLIILAGPTAVGKTALSIKLAKALNGEIISADSVQVYKKLNIGSAKITSEEMDGVPHHLIDVLEPDEDFNVAIFQELFKEAVTKIRANGHVPILTGGTGFYVQAVLKDVDFTKGESDERVRAELEALLSKNGNIFLHEMLKAIDPEAAAAIPAGNAKRVIRAIEYFKVTGEKISVHNAAHKDKPSSFDYKYFVLNDERQKLYDRIDYRVDKMIEDGLEKEVRQLYEGNISRAAVSMQSLGYRQMLDYFYGDVTLDEAIYQIKLQTRHFAKRQLTWYRREPDVIWVNKPDFDYNEDKMIDFMINKSEEIM